MAFSANGNTIESFSYGLPPVLSLSAATTAGTTGAVLDAVVVRSLAVAQITASTGVTAGAIQLQSSLDGTNFWNLGSPVTVSAAGTTAESFNLSANSGNVGRYLRAVVSIVAVVTTTSNKGWLPADLNDGHLDYYFWLWTGISAINFVVYAAFAKNYTVKRLAVPHSH